MSKSKDNKRQFFRDPDKIAEGLLNAEFMHIPEVPDERTFRREERDGAAFTLVHWQDDFCQWREGCYYRIPDSDMRAIVTRHMQTLKTQAGDDDQDVRITTGNVNNVLLCLKGKVHIPSDRKANSWADCREKLGIHSIAFNNGILLYSPYKTGPHPVLAPSTPNFFNVVILPYDFNPEAKAPMWQSFLETAMLGNREYIRLLQQWCAYLFRPDLREQRFLLCPGPGANGKGVCFEVVQALVGKDNCSQVPLSRFNNSFSLHPTLGKLVNVTNESSHMINDETEAILKSYIAGDAFTFERKYRDPVHAVPTAKIMVATNSLPRFADKSQGIWRRLLLVPFKHVVPPEDQIRDLAQTIIREEIGGVFCWALEGLADLNEHSFVIPAKNTEEVEEYRRDSDPARAFLLENFICSPNAGDTSCADVYQSYRQWCEDNGYKALGERTFGKQIKAIFPSVERRRSGPRGDRQYVYHGLVSHVSYVGLI